jgi:diaminopimelate epimerase
MEFKFYKYEGTGNDFVLIDNRNLDFPKNNLKLIEQFCNRRFGIGGDGLILLENDSASDFKMVYYNSDGNQSSMCGNGGRCLVAYAKKIGVIQNNATFMAMDGLHHAIIDSNSLVSLQMIAVTEIKINLDYVFLNTGSPHHVVLVDNLSNFDVKKEGAKIRHSSLYGKEGCNVNFVTQITENKFAIRTYERGVEDETLSCGTGATAVAIAMHALRKTTHNNIVINVEGGMLEVTFTIENGVYNEVLLKGPATFVFEGLIHA